MLLSVKKRQSYLKFLGFYDGAIDGKAGVKTKAAYKKLQNTYFIRKKDKDGVYGKNTDILLRNAYNQKVYAPLIPLEKIKCKCKGKYCTGYPVVMSTRALTYMNDDKEKYPKISFTSVMRCNTWNKKVGGTSGSKHKQGKAWDMNGTYANGTLARRKEEINSFIKKKYANYAYCNGYARTKYRTTYPKSSTMGSSIHKNV